MYILLYTAATFITGYFLGRLVGKGDEKVIIVHEKEPEIQTVPEYTQPSLYQEMSAPVQPYPPLYPDFAQQK